MRIHREARVYARFTLDGLPDPAPTAVEVRLTATGAWQPLTQDGDVWMILVAGPDAETHASATVLPLGRHLPVVRIVDNPEIVLDETAPIDVY